MVFTTLLHPSFYFVLLLALLAGATHAPSAALAGDRLVVKYRAGFAECVDCLLNSGARFGSELDDLHRSLDVLQARPLFVPVGAARSTSATSAQRAAQARARFPERARRATSARSPDLSNVYVLELGPGTDVHGAALRYAAAAAVEWAHPDVEYTLTYVPDDPLYASSGTWGQSYADLWGLHVTDAATAWDASAGSGVIVAVVDSGVDAGHPDLIGNLWTNAGEIAGNAIDDDGNGFVDDVDGWDFTSGDNVPEDTLGHGTHVAGTVAATGDNGVGVVGMAWEARVMPVRVFGNGSAPVSVIAEGVVYAAENGADIINASFGGPATQVMADAVQAARALGVIVVAAAGNAASDAAEYDPASLPGVITVSASDVDDDPAVFTNFGDPVSVAGPGVEVVSLQATGTALGPVVASGYVRLSGTSMATPHVAGLAAVLLGAQPGLDEDQVRWHLELNADQPGIAGWEGARWNPYLGYGRIDAGRVFDPPPASARMRPARVERHVFAGGTSSLPDASLSFTTYDPVAWSLLAPPWIALGTASGVGPAAIPFALDATGLSGGETVSGSVTADASGLAFSESTTVTAHVHVDDRSGPEFPIEVSSLPHFPVNSSGLPGPFHVRMASNGTRALVVWNRPTSISGRLIGALVDDQGVIVAPFTITETNTRHLFDVASDGQDFLVVWIENPDDIFDSPTTRRISAARVLADGTLTPGPAADPIFVDARLYRPYHLAYFPRVAFDGSDYVVAWQRRDVRTAGARPYRTWVYFSRVAPDGTPSLTRKKLALRDADRTRPVSGVDLDCLPGRCLFTWKQDFSHHFVRLVGERPDYRNRRRVHHQYFFSADDFIAGSDGYLVVGRASESCLPGTSSCVREVRGIRVDEAGNALDGDLVRLSQGTKPRTQSFLQEVLGGFDGTDYLVSFGLPAARAGITTSTPLFLARLAPDGTLRVGEHEGGLVTPRDSTARSAATTVNGRLLVAWRDSRDAIASNPNNPAFASVYAQPLAP